MASGAFLEVMRLDCVYVEVNQQATEWRLFGRIFVVDAVYIAGKFFQLLREAEDFVDDTVLELNIKKLVSQNIGIQQRVMTLKGAEISDFSRVKPRNVKAEWQGLVFWKCDRSIALLPRAIASPTKKWRESANEFAMNGETLLFFSDDDSDCFTTNSKGISSSSI